MEYISAFSLVIFLLTTLQGNAAEPPAKRRIIAETSSPSVVSHQEAAQPYAPSHQNQISLPEDVLSEVRKKFYPNAAADDKLLLELFVLKQKNPALQIEIEEYKF